MVLVESWGMLKVLKPKEERPYTTDDIILHIFYLVATSLPAIARHSQTKLYPSELVTIGILFALKGGHFRAFYRWQEGDYGIPAFDGRGGRAPTPYCNP